MLVMLLTSWLALQASNRGAESIFRSLHLVSSAAYSLGHGLNDAQKTMGIITVLLFSTGYLSGEFHVPHWVAISCYIAIGLGTMTGGWKIIETMGSRITKLLRIRDSLPDRGSALLFAPAISASRCRPRTPSPDRSSALASPAAPLRCVGASPRTSSWPG